MKRRRLRGLRGELEALEATNPEVAEARRRFEDVLGDIARHERHLAARRAVGKRAMPEEDRRE